MRRMLIMTVTFAGGLYYFCKFLFPREWGLQDTLPTVTGVIIAISALAIGIGVINLWIHHLQVIVRRRAGWYNSAALLVAMVTMLVSVLLKFYYPDSGTFKAFFQFLFQQVYLALDKTTFSLLALYMASAAYRSFRVRSREATVMMVVSLMVMLGQMPMGQQLTRDLASTEPTWNVFWQSLKFEHLRAWIMDVWNVGAQRGIAFASMAGAVAFSLRLWFSLERGSFFEDKS